MALQLARQGQGHVEPNPMVGCVIVRQDQVIGRGYHKRFGGPHAEIEALRDCGDAERARGATAYVTLEPCCHHGKTPPCSDALVRAGVARVVIAMSDPFAEVDGGGIAALRAAGIETSVGVLQAEAEELNAPYLKRVRSGRPWTIAKWAMTVDGRIATATGESQWITGEASRAEVHRLRGRVDAVIVGMGTVEADDPRLTARPPGPRVATRVVFCRHRLPSPDSNLIGSADQAPVILAVAPSIEAERTEPLAGRGAEVLPCSSQDPVQMVADTLSQLGKRQMTNVMVEGGGELLASFFEADLVDQLHVYIGAKLVGGRSAAGPVAGRGIAQIDRALRWQLQSATPIGDDLLAIYGRRSRD